MRKYLTIIIALLAMTAVFARPKKAKSMFAEAGRMYIYGISYSAGDSVVYMTDLIYIDSAQISGRTKFLVNRNGLSNQLRNHMAGKGMPARTCCVVFNKSLNKIDKDYKKQVAFYQKHGYVIKSIDQTEFRFTTIREEED